LKSRRTALWHLGHRGSSRDSITYIMHRGHPARIIGKPPTTPSSGLPSDDTHELGGDAVEDDDDESLLGDPPPLTTGFADDAPPRDRDDRLRRSSCSLDTLPLLFLLIFSLSLLSAVGPKLFSRLHAQY
jgi:hypothetical protein